MGSTQEKLDYLALRLLGSDAGRLYPSSSRLVFGEGNPEAALVVVGEAPGAEEDITGRPFCLVPETQVLLADLSWRPLGDLRVGDRVLTMDELPTTVGRGVTRYAARQWVVATVTAAHRRLPQRVLTVVTEDGDLTGTPDHRVLLGSNPRIGVESADRWFARLDGLLVPSASETAGRRGSKLLGIGEPWRRREDYDTGWLAGFLDGEGHIDGSRTVKEGRARRKGTIHTGFSQNTGPTLDRAKEIIRALGFQTSNAGAGTFKANTCWRNDISGGFLETIRFLGTVGPRRLIEDFNLVISSHPTGTRRLRRPRVLGRYWSASPVETVDISTTAGTYIANGFVVHNCGPSGKLLDKVLWKAGYRREEIYICNVVKRRPPGNRDPGPEEVRVSLPWLHAQLALVRPRTVLAVGRFAANALAGTDGLPIGALREMRDARYRNERTDVDVPLVATYHPAYVLRQLQYGPADLEKFARDVRRATRLSRGVE